MIVGMILCFSDSRIRRDDPLRSKKIVEYKAGLRLSSADEKLKRYIRQFVLELRARYFRYLLRKESGIYILLGAASIFVLATFRLNRLKRSLPMPGPKPDSSARALKL